MADVRTNSTARGRRDGEPWPQLVGLLVLAALVAWWAWRAFHDPQPRDTGLAYDAGQVAWASGHPERLGTWNGMPFLVVALALVGRVVSIRTTADAITALNVILAVAVIAAGLRRVRERMPAVWWWVAAFGLLTFAPLMSSVWWKQFNVIALGLAIAGFELARRGRAGTGALAIGLSVSVKPLVFLLPLVLLVRRETRRVGALSIAWIAGLDVAAQAFLGLRAHDLGAANPILGIRNLVHRTSAAGNIFLCHPLNFSPTSLFCRLNGGFQHWTLQRLAVLGLVILLGAWVVTALRGRSALSWEVLAFTCPLSVMLSALAWTHYQIMLAPLFLLLLVRFASEGADFAAWLGLAVAFVLASLMWEPYGTVATQIQGISQSPLKPTFLEEYAQFAQYVLVITGVIWYSRRRSQPLERRGPAVGDEHQPLVLPAAGAAGGLS